MFYFDDAAGVEEIDLERVRHLVVDVITTWEDRTAAALDRAFGPTEGRRLFRRYIRIEERSGLYREITRPDEVPEDLQRFEQLQDRLEIRILPRAAGSATVKLFSPTPLELVDTLRTLEHLGLVVREEVSVPLMLPEGRRGFLQRLRVEGTPAVVERLPATEASLLDALRALHEGRAANDRAERAAACGGAAVARDRTASHAAQLPAPDPAAVHVRHPDRGAAQEQRRGRGAVSVCSPRASIRRPVTALAHSCSRRAKTRSRRASAGVASVLHDEILQAFENVVRAVVRTNFYQQPERPVIASRSTAGRSTDCRRRARCSRSTSTRRCSKACTCAAAAWRAAASAGAIVPTISGPRFSV